MKDEGLSERQVKHLKTNLSTVQKENTSLREKVQLLEKKLTEKQMSYEDKAKKDIIRSKLLDICFSVIKWGLILMIAGAVFYLVYPKYHFVGREGPPPFRCNKFNGEVEFYTGEWKLLQKAKQTRFVFNGLQKKEQIKDPSDPLGILNETEKNKE